MFVFSSKLPLYLLVAVLLGVCAPLDVTAQRSSDDPEERATSLRSAGESPRTIAGELRDVFRSTTLDLAVIFQRTGFSAEETADALSSAPRITHTEVGSAMKEAGFSLDDIGRGMQRSGARTEQVVAALHALEAPIDILFTLDGVQRDPVSIVPDALGAGYSVGSLVDGLDKHGFSRQETVAAIAVIDRHADTLIGTVAERGWAVEEVMSGLRDAGMLAPEAAAKVREILRVQLLEMARALDQAGYSYVEIAEALREEYRVNAAQAAHTLRDILAEKGETAAALHYIAEVLRVVFDEEAYGAYLILTEMGYDKNIIGPSLTAGGYEVPVPQITKFWIDDHRYGHSGILEDYGIGAPGGSFRSDITDEFGIVYIQGKNLNEPDLEVLMPGVSGGDVSGNILESSGTGTQDLLKVQFYNFAAGSLRVETWAGVGVRPSVGRLTVHELSTDLLNEFTDQFSLTIGDPVGTAAISVGPETQTADISPFRVRGGTVEIVGLQTRQLDVWFSEGPQTGTANFHIRVPFEETGAYSIDGVIADSVGYYRCSTFEIPGMTCPNAKLSLSCIGDHFGGIIQGGTQCANPENWDRILKWEGPAIPYQASLLDPEIEIIVMLAPHGAQGISSSNIEVKYTGGVALMLPDGPEELEGIKPYLENEVSSSLTYAAQELDFGAILSNLISSAFLFAEDVEGLAAPGSTWLRIDAVSF